MHKGGTRLNGSPGETLEKNRVNPALESRISVGSA